MDISPRLTRCSAGKGRWFWLVLFPIPMKRYDGSIGDPSCYEALHGNDEDARRSGFAATETAAEAAALKAAGPGPVEWISAISAQHEMRCLTQRKRAAKPPSNAKDSAAIEFVYEPPYDPYSSLTDVHDMGYWTKYRIVKKTKARIYVDRERWFRRERQNKTNSDHWEYPQETFVLPRVEFEETGKCYSRSQCGRFYAKPEIWLEEFD